MIGDRAIALALDGGVTRANIGEIASFGPDLIVAGSAVFDGGDVSDNLGRMIAELARAGAARVAGASAS
jgi:ribulose-phosphate 3-epimerase